MRTALSNRMTEAAKSNPEFLVLSGDHGYALFDEIRKQCPDQFVNVGVMEQSMVGLAAGVAKLGFRPLVYGLASFVPVRVLEQIKLDVCYPGLPVTFIGDGAGLVYSTLGASHQCAEDIACLKTLPGMRVYSPCDADELNICFKESMSYPGPSYLRVGKADRPKVHVKALANSLPHFVTRSERASKVCLVASGSMVSIGGQIAGTLGLSCVSVPKIHPLDSEALLGMLSGFEKIIVLEEHSRQGGLTSSICDAYFASTHPHPKLVALTLKDRFTHLCGSYQYALSEHELSDRQLMERIRAEVPEVQ